MLPLDEGAPFAPLLVKGASRGGGMGLEVAGAVIRVSAETDRALPGAVVATLKGSR